MIYIDILDYKAALMIAPFSTINPSTSARIVLKRKLQKEEGRSPDRARIETCPCENGRSPEHAYVRGYVHVR